MAVHPKIGIVGTIVLFGVSAGLALFVLGRMSAGQSLTGWLVGTGIGLVIIASVGIGVLRHLPASSRMQGLQHQGAQTAAEGYISRPVRGDLVGRQGVTLTELRPVGTADIDGERVDVTTDGQFVSKGTPVTVVRADNMKVIVRPVPRVTA